MPRDDMDELVTDTAVRKEFGAITHVTMWRWTNDPALDFPKPVKIRSRNYRSRREVEAFKERMLHRGLAQLDAAR